jgi:hypothetical protein
VRCWVKVVMGMYPEDGIPVRAQEAGVSYRRKAEMREGVKKTRRPRNPGYLGNGAVWQNDLRH